MVSIRNVGYTAMEEVAAGASASEAAWVADVQQAMDWVLVSAYRSGMFPLIIPMFSSRMARLIPGKVQENKPASFALLEK